MLIVQRGDFGAGVETACPPGHLGDRQSFVEREVALACIEQRETGLRSGYRPSPSVHRRYQRHVGAGGSER